MGVEVDTMSLSVQALDLYDDLARVQLRQIAPEAPGFIKAASLADASEIAELPTEAFALHALTKEGSRLKKYPIHTPADTWMSCAFFEKNAHKLPKTARTIAATHLKQACVRFGLPVKAQIQKCASTQTAGTNIYIEETDMRKTASVLPEIEYRPQQGAYALNGRYPLFSPEHVKQAAAYFTEHFNQFEPSDRHEYAQNVLARAEELRAEVDPRHAATLQKVAGQDYGDRLEGQLRIRYAYIDGNVQASERLEKVASLKGHVEPGEFAALLQKWDQETGITRAYGTKVLDAYQSTFDNTMTKQAGYLWEDSQSGLQITGEELTKAASDKYEKIKGYFGETLASSLKKHGSQIFESLPADAKVTIAKIAKGGL
jgi:hypothetical protein